VPDPLNDSPAGPPANARTSRPDDHRPARSAAIGFAAVLIAAVAFAGLLGQGATGPALVLCVPIALGAICGLVVPSASVLFRVGLIGGGIVTLVGVLMLADLAGLFCGVFYAVVAFLPAMIAGLIVLWIRGVLDRRVSSRRVKRRVDALLLLAAVALPLAQSAIERRWPTRHARESLEFSRTIDRPIAEVWSSRLCCGAARNPWFEAIDAPLPRAAAGGATQVGDEKQVRFDKGVIRARVVRLDPGRELVAEVFEQTIERKALRMLAVTVTCDALGPDRTGANLRLDFVPLMGPRWYLRPVERRFGWITFDALLDAWESGTPHASPAARAARAEGWAEGRGSDGNGRPSAVTRPRSPPSQAPVP
jgi:uncharacterized protein YndB with AHSA1/START domain